jgi:hypothetical protein
MSAPDLSDPTVSRLVISGHPNHELAIFGFLQRLRPRLLFLTDGGAEERVAESRRALEGLGLLDRARFLGWSEKRLYRALLEHDTATIEDLVASVREEIERSAARQVICESVEFYNPLHDLTLPIVMAASRGIAGIEIVEFPLISQIPAATEVYRVQRFDSARDLTELHLTGEEVTAKLAARDDHYSCLRRQLGPVLAELDEDDLATEVFAAAPAVLRTPGEGSLLRYEWRGRQLEERGEVEHVITYRDHFLPTIAGLTGRLD